MLEQNIYINSRPLMVIYHRKIRLKKKTHPKNKSISSPDGQGAKGWDALTKNWF